MVKIIKAGTFILSLGLLLCLGFWQLHRAAEKESLLSQSQQQTKQSPRDWAPKLPKPSQYARIRLQGRYADPIFYLDNQYHQHQFGVHVLSPFYIDAHTVVMVDRGWVTREAKATTPQGKQTLIGQVYYPSKNPWIGAEQDKTQLIEQFDAIYLSKILHQDVTPFIMRLDPAQPFGFIREWSVVTMSPQRHRGYAVQWFALAVLVLIYGIVTYGKK